jgi:NAD(P)H-nitrite reductase large subunit
MRRGDQEMATQNVIIGGGPAGIAAIETIREFDGGTSSITLISDEPAYARMALPYYLAGEIPEDQVLIGSPRYFDQMKVEARSGRVASIAPKEKRLTLEDGSTVAFDNLLIATGSSAARLNVPGSDLRGVTTLWTIEDAHQALAGLPENAEVVFIGAGFIGFIILNAMHKRGCRLSVVEIQEHVLPRMMDADGARVVEDWLAKSGVQVHTGATVAEIAQRADGRKTVRLADGRDLPADLVVLSTGIRPNLGFLDGSGIKTAQGILVNQRMQTNFPNIYAAGDVAEGPDLLTGQPAIHAIQPTAVDHGRVAGANMAGQKVEYPGSLLINILDVCGLQCCSFGQWHANGGETQVVANAARPVFRKLVWDGDRIAGAIFVGRMDDVAMLNDVGMAKGFIQAKAHLGEWKGYLQKHPTDLRRAYVGARVAAQLLGVTTVGRPSNDRHYRYRDLRPWTQPSPHHAALVGTKPAAEP